MMNPEERRILIKQLVDVIAKHDGDENFNYFGHFYKECEKFNITEIEFRQQFLKNAFIDYGNREKENPELVVPNPNRYVNLFDKKRFNTMQLGRALFDHPSNALTYLANEIALQHDVTLLSKSSETGLEAVRIFQSENNERLRYLKIVYWLNDRLPYRVGGKLFETWDALLTDLPDDNQLYRLVVNDFINGYLQTWLQATHKALLDQRPDLQQLLSGFSDIGFLQFLYRYDPGFPYYLDERLFRTPGELSLAIHTQREVAATVYKAWKSGTLHVWFQTLYLSQSVEDYGQRIEMLFDTGLLTDEQAKAIAAQELASLIDSKLVKPTFIPSVAAIKLPNLEGEKPVTTSITLHHQGVGFTFIHASLSNQHQAFSLEPAIVKLDDQKLAESQQTFSFTVDPFLLTKDKTYETDIVLKGLYSELIIPVLVKVVFPKKAFIRYITIYGLIGVAILGGVRLLLEVFLNGPGWLENYDHSYMYDGRLLQSSYITVFCFALLVVSVVLFFRYTKKKERTQL